MRHTFFRSRARGAAAGFTLIEMLVSLAVMSVALTVVGVVFAITTRAASQSAAYSEANNWVRQALEQIRADLAECNPTESILVLVGRTQRAGLTADDVAAGRLHRVLIGNLNDPNLSSYDPQYAPDVDADGNYSDPRADIMAFITNRPTVSQAPPSYSVDTSPNPYRGGAKLAPVLAVYGHAALADPEWGGSAYSWPADFNSDLRHIGQTFVVDNRELSRIPAVQWHLSRRATILSRPFNPAGFPADVTVPQTQRNDVVLGRPHDDNSNGWMAGDAVKLDYALLLEALNPSGIYTPAPVLHSPYVYPNNPWQQRIKDSVDSLLYSAAANSAYLHVATVLSEVPVELQGNLGMHLLPGCAWFQVEFLMPEDPRNSVEYSFPDPNLSDFSRRSDMPRWTSVTPGETYVFVPDSAENREELARQLTSNGNPTGRLLDFARLDQDPAKHAWNAHLGTDPISQRVIRTWPYAIRVTVHVYDPRGRLTEPIVRSVVHRFD